MPDQDKHTGKHHDPQPSTADNPRPLANEASDDAYRQSYQSISTVLDSLDALVYVTDMRTHEILFFNAYGRSIWGDAQGRICWQVLQDGQTGPCAFCTNDRLLDDNGEPTGVYVWEFQNTVNGHWYQCRDQAIRWVDDRLVRMEIATDITDRKLAEEELKAAKEQAESLARTDELTGLNNRRAFFHDGQQLLNQAKRFAHPFALIMLDVDHFKRINDNYGHTIGDSVLVDLAQIIRNNTRDVDILGRLGGEEFAVILPETSLTNAIAMAERLREQIAIATHDSAKGDVQFTASFGVSAYAPDRPTLESLISHADDALYRAKKNGRNRIEIAY